MDTSGQRIGNPCNVCNVRTKLGFHFPHGGTRVVCDGCGSFGAVSYAGHDAAIGLWNQTQQQKKGLA